MAYLYVARSSNFSKWSSDVGLSKFVFKIGIAEDDPKALIAEGWAGETDWLAVAKRALDLPLDEAELFERLARKEKHLDPALYPRLRGLGGFFKVSPVNVENHMIVARALSGAEALRDTKPKPADFAAYLFANALKTSTL